MVTDAAQYVRNDNYSADEQKGRMPGRSLQNSVNSVRSNQIGEQMEALALNHRGKNQFMKSFV